MLLVQYGAQLKKIELIRHLLVAALVLLAGLGICSCDSCHQRRQSKGTSERVILIGTDGMTWSILEPMLAAGELPHIQRLVREGTRAVVRAERPLISPAIWTTIATGKPRREHGIRNFFLKTRGSYTPVHYSSRHRRALPLWSIVGRQHPVGVVRWFVTYPAQPVNGALVAFRYGGGANDASSLTYPPELAQQIQAARAHWTKVSRWHHQVTQLKLPPAVTQAESLAGWAHRRRVGFLKQVYARDHDVTNTARFIIDRYAPALTMVFLNGIDRVSHKFWKLQYGDEAASCTDVDAHQASQFKEAVRDAYRQTDWLIGRLIASDGKARPRVLIVSDHGFEAAPPEGAAFFDMNRLLRALDFVVGSGPDWNETQAFAISDHYRDVRGIYLNVRGIEASGIVDPNDVPELLIELREALSGVRKPDGSRLIGFVDDDPGPPVVGEQPADLRYRLYPPNHLDAPIHIGNEIIRYRDLCHLDLFNSGRHHPDGVLVASGHGIRLDTRAGVIRHLDLVPTILALMKLPVARDMPGRVLDNLLTAQWTKNNPIQWVSSYEAAEGTNKETLFEARPLEDAALEELRSLGYIQ